MMRLSRHLTCGGVGAIAFAVWFSAHHVVVLGTSMQPTYYAGAVLETVPYEGQSLHRGDIVVASSPIGRIVKRIGFVAGDRISSFYMGKDGWADVIYQDRPVGSSRHTKSRIIGPDRLYLLGDSLTSIDSQSFGDVPEGAIERVAIAPRPFHASFNSRPFTYIERRERQIFRPHLRDQSYHVYGHSRYIDVIR